MSAPPPPPHIFFLHPSLLSMYKHVTQNDTYIYISFVSVSHVGYLFIFNFEQLHWQWKAVHAKIAKDRYILVEAKWGLFPWWLMLGRHGNNRATDATLSCLVVVDGRRVGESSKTPRPKPSCCPKISTETAKDFFHLVWCKYFYILCHFNYHVC